MSSNGTIYIASRGSALALAQAHFILGECRREFPDLAFELRIIRTTGDKLQTASLSRIDTALPRGLFTKEIEDALLNGDADLAVHSLKDLPTILPDGLKLGAAGKREDVRDVLIYRQSAPVLASIKDLPHGSTVATSSTRRSAQLLHLRPDVKIVPIRGNVGTRLHKLAGQPELDATILAAAGFARLGFRIAADGALSGEGLPEGLRAIKIEPSEMLPCVGQAALGIESREKDERIDRICARLNDEATWHCVTAERAFLRGMGGGCQSPVGALAEISGDELRIRAVSFVGGAVKHGSRTGPVANAAELGESLAGELKG
jgi:hydroxymethylbilane synthase